MKKRPLALSFFSYALLGIAISMPAQAIYIQNVQDLFQSLTFLNLIVMVLCVATAVTAYKVHASFQYLLPLTMCAVIFNNWWVGYVGFNFDLIQTSVGSLGFVCLCGVLLEENTLQVLANPNLKWWEVATRAKAQIPVSLFPIRGEALNKTTFDISESGVFLQGLDTEELDRLIVGEKLNVCLHFNKIIKIRCEAKIVRKAEAAGGIYPAGVGLQFESPDYQMKLAIQRLQDASA